MGRLAHDRDVGRSYCCLRDVMLSGGAFWRLFFFVGCALTLVALHLLVEDEECAANVELWRS
jgi:hypothetical protein